MFHGASLPSVRSLYQSAGFRVGTFECQPGDPAWAAENNIGDGYHVVFPGTPVLIAQAGAPEIVANPNHAVFYNPGQAYRRGLLSPSGDRCLFVRTSSDALAGGAEAWGLPLDTASPRSFPFVDGPLDRATYRRQRLLGQYLQETSSPDDLLVQETILNLVGQAIRDAFAVRGTRTDPRRRAADSRRAALVEEAKSIVATRFREAIGLDGLARMLDVSPFHLARVFRARTGYSLHRYRAELRLRAALDLLAGGPWDLTSIALDLGYASHSHFSDAFQRAFGVTPSAYRAAARTTVRRPLSFLRA
jgi:AraC-like DNA-binding protein